MPFDIPAAYQYVPAPPEPAAPVVAKAAPKAAPKGARAKTAPVKAPPPPRPEELAPLGVIVTHAAQDAGQTRPVQGMDASPVRGGVIFHRIACANLTCDYEAGYVGDRDIKSQKFAAGIATDKMKIVAKSYRALDDAEAAIDFKLITAPNSNVISVAELRKLPKVAPAE